MTRAEILEKYKEVKIRLPKKGEYFLACKNRGGIYSVQRASKNFKYVRAMILEVK